MRARLAWRVLAASAPAVAAANAAPAGATPAAQGPGIGDLVQIVETRPLSKDKRWAVEAILKHKRAQVVTAVEGEGEPA